MPAEFPLPPAQRTFLTPAFRKNCLLSFSFGCAIDRAKFRDAWFSLVRIHPVLRSSFQDGCILEHEELAQAQPAFEEVDWSGEELPGIAGKWHALQERAVTAFLDPQKPPLWKIYLILLPGGQSHLLAAFHPGLLDRQAVATLLVQWLTVAEADPAQVAKIPALPGLALANASVDLGSPLEPMWPQEWDGDYALEILRPWHWIAPGETVEEQPAHIEVRTGVTPALVEKIRSLAQELEASPQEILSVLWAGFWALRSEIGAALTAHPCDLLPHLAPEHREILGRLSPLAPFALRSTPPANKEWAHDWWQSQLSHLRQSGSHIFAQPPPSLEEILQFVGLNPEDVYPAHGAFWNEGSVNDFLHTRLPKWLGADARWDEPPALPVSLLMQGGRHPEASLIAHPSQLDRATCSQILGDFLAQCEKALGLPESEGHKPTGAAPAKPGALFALSSEPTISRRLSDALGLRATAVLLQQGETSMTGADLLGCSNQLARHLRRLKLADGTRYLVNLPQGNWFALVVLTLVREGLPFVVCDRYVKGEDAAEFLKRETIGCVLLESGVAEGWENVETKKVILDTAWDKIGGMSDAPLQPRRQSAPPVWEFVSDAGCQRYRVGEALLNTLLPPAAELLGLEPGARLLSTASPGSLGALSEVLLASLTGTTLVFPSRDIFATRSAFQETLLESQITHLSLPASRWSDWVHFLVELRQPLPPTLRSVAIASGRIGLRAVKEWLRVSEGRIVTSLTHQPAGMPAPVMGCELNEFCIPLLQSGLFVLGPAVGECEVVAISKDGNPLPSGYVGSLRLNLPTGAVVDGIVRSEVDFGLRGIVMPGGIVCALIQPDVKLPDGAWMRPPAPVAAGAESTLLKRPEIFDAFVVRKSAENKGAERLLCGWVIPSESGGSLPPGLAIWWKNETSLAWRLEAVASIPKCPVTVDGRLDASALPTPVAIAFQPAPLPSSKKAKAEETEVDEKIPNWRIELPTDADPELPVIVFCGTTPHGDFIPKLQSVADGTFRVVSAEIPPPGAPLPSLPGASALIAHAGEAWELLRWVNSANEEVLQELRILLLHPITTEPTPALDIQLRSLWQRILGRPATANARRDTARGIRPVRCAKKVYVLLPDEPESALATYLPEAEFFAGDLTSPSAMAEAVLDVLVGEVVEEQNSKS